MFRDARPTCTIVRNEATFSPTNAFQFQDSLNLETFATAPPLYAKMNSIQGMQQYSYGQLYYQVTYEIELCRESHVEFILDADWRDINGNLFRDYTGQALSNPTLLNGRGLKNSVAVDEVEVEMDAVTTSLTLVDYPSFPPGAEVNNSSGYMPSGDYYFVVRIDNELMQVTNTKPITSSALTVVRGFGGTTAAVHHIGAKITLEPYYRRYIPSPVKSWAPLSLPVV